MQRTGCKALVCSSETRNLASELDTNPRFEISPLEELMVSEAPVFPYNKAFRDAVNEPILVVHSSGTTGWSFCVTQSLHP